MSSLFSVCQHMQLETYAWREITLQHLSLNHLSITSRMRSNSTHYPLQVDYFIHFSILYCNSSHNSSIHESKKFVIFSVEFAAAVI